MKNIINAILWQRNFTEIFYFVLAAAANAELEVVGKSPPLV